MSRAMALFVQAACIGLLAALWADGVPLMRWLAPVGIALCVMFMFLIATR